MIIVGEGDRKEFYLIPAETYQAVCFGVWDIGKQKTSYKGEEKIVRKVILAFEINDKMPEGKYEGKRPCVYKRYTASLNEKAILRKDLESWRGKAFTLDELKRFDIENLIDKNCMLSIVHNESGNKTYANVGSISKLMKGLMSLSVENTRSMPEWVQKIKDKAVEEDYEQAEEVSSGEEEEIPF